MTKLRYPTFADFVSPEPNTGCHLWAGPGQGRGYGSYRQRQAHRLAYEKANGPVPEGLSVLHRCDTPACVNPDHLFVGTQLDNIRDRDRKGRTRGVGRRLRFT